MKSVLVIFNGIKFPYYLMDYAIAQAKYHHASVHALFLKAGKESSEGYGFPSDMAQAETLTNSEDALQDDEKIISKQMHLAEGMGEMENVTCTTEMMTDCSLKDMLELVKNHDLICLDVTFDDETPAMLTSNRFTSRELISQTSSPVKMVEEGKTAKIRI